MDYFIDHTGDQMFYSDFGLFYQLPRVPAFTDLNVINTYVYRALKVSIRCKLTPTYISLLRSALFWCWAPISLCERSWTGQCCSDKPSSGLRVKTAWEWEQLGWEREFLVRKGELPWKRRKYRRRGSRTQFHRHINLNAGSQRDSDRLMALACTHAGSNRYGH